MSDNKKSGCGCCSCLIGCFFLIVLLLVATVAGGYFVVSQKGAIFDAGLKYSYPFAKPFIEKQIAESFPKQKDEIIQRVDRDVIDYLSLSPDERAKVRDQLILIFKEGDSPQTNPVVQIQEVEALIQELKTN